jgi:deazaflavin-dependent oxidoreductase (nitroreductase family)
MLCDRFQPIEKRFFRTLNKFLEPVIKVGVGFPGLSPVGAIILETRGRKSGQTYQTPVLASEFDDFLIISTARSRSQWVKNLAVTPQTRIWLRGQSQPVSAYVIGSEVDQAATSPTIQPVIKRLRSLSKLTGASFAILEKKALPQLASSPNVIGRFEPARG